ncbi:MAG TPA: IclR family transcriptional regulator [Terriglobia bacterium]|jgi:DNA-binding IclR family transcriptional regulator|nr:IclR family transcriptional regulator [Terriglobia bacterium]
MAKASTKGKRKTGQLDKNYIRVMEKIFVVLEHFIKEGARQEALSFQTVAASVPFAKTTVHRILYSLQKLGYLERDSARTRYRLGPKFFELTEPAVHFRRLQSVATSVMTELLVRFSENVNLGVLDSSQVAYLSVLQSPSALRVAAFPGQRNPVHSTALGKAIVAFLGEEEAAAIIDQRPLIKMTPKTITQRAHFSEHLAAVRERGVAFDLAENVEGVTCVAAPIFDQRGRAVAAISVSGPATRMEAKLGRIEEEVREAGLKTSRMLGFGLGHDQDRSTSADDLERGREEAIPR